MTDSHERFRGQLAAHLVEVLPETEAAWMEAHAAECSACAALRDRMRSKLPDLAEDAQHVPVSLLHRWTTSSNALTETERELIVQHLETCTRCRNEAASMAEWSGLQSSGTNTSRNRPASLATWLAAAAVIAIVLTVVRPDRRAPELPSRPAPMEPERGGGETAPSSITLTLLDRTRSARSGDEPEASSPGPGTALRLKLPPVFIEESQQVVVRVERSDGNLVWESRMAARELSDTLTPATPSIGWGPGRYRLILVPAAGRDTAAARVFGFRLREPNAN